MGPVEATQSCLKKYFQFSGRATRSEYWWFFAVTIMLVYGTSALGLDTLSSIGWLLTIIPWLAVSWRRLHDSGLSGAWILLPAAIFIAGIYGFLFSHLAKIVPVLEDVGFSDDTTLGEMRNVLAGHQLEIQNLLFEWSTGNIVSALMCVGGMLFAIYLKTRPSDPNDNRYGALIAHQSASQ